MGFMSWLTGINPDPEDSFLEQVAFEKKQTESTIAAASKQHEHNLEAQFGDDLKLKARLSEFARTNKLDEALIELWEEIKSYPDLSKREDFDKWNKLRITDVYGSSENKNNSVAFTYGKHGFKAIEHVWRGMDNDECVNYSLFEDGEEVFAIDCSVNYSDYGRCCQCYNIVAFRKRGTWAKTLIEFYGRIQIEQKKRSSEFSYYGADKIKSRFQE